MTALQCTYKDSCFLEQVSYQPQEAKYFLKNWSRAASPNSPPFIKRNGSLPSPQKPAAIPYLHPQLPEDLFKCHPSIYAYVSQVVSFHVYRLKLWTHFSSPQCAWYALHISSFLTYDTHRTIMLHDTSFPPASYQFPVPLTHTIFPTPHFQISSNLCSSLIVWD
jgi:hypothetical protein